MKKSIVVFFTILTALTSAFASNGPGTRLNCQYTQGEKVLVQLNIGAFGNFALFKAKSMDKAERTDILSHYETPYELVLDGYMPEGWTRGTAFRINLQKNSPFHDILIDDPNGKFQRLSMTCNGQWAM